ncbi:MFS transporter, OFA family, oxalate/formate antiporter [Sporobacter termitidis DSM 10068]|uniref:MFS transporter, OFA family, oxalate/formate antiporter n=1 Tax=Sporobacter termitidis DSM 10068 TaxID=1123282 RepID=A0A1M5TSJ8_9FIRM|nr:MFS transporter [Sporobacter termitidis]SHH53638.1 MFS transporter, OFA family, oxalate/formate antiporter [Sporobacter termitidis DSM 10068]
MEKKVNINVRWVQLVVGVIVLLFAGIIYAWSILNAPLKNEFGWNAAQLGLNFTITVSLFCIGGFISGLISKKTTPMLRLLIGAVLFFAGFLIASQMGNSIAVLYLSYGVLAGLGIGFVYNTIIGVVSAWFPDKRGLASGLMLMGFGLNSILIGKIADAYIKMENVGWRTTYIVLAIITTVIFIIAAFIIKNPPAGAVFPAPKGAASKDQGDVKALEIPPLQMIKRASFWQLFIFFILLASVGSASISFAKNIITDAGAADTFAVTMVGLISIGNGLGRLVSGWLFDNIGRRKTQFVTSAVAIVAPLVVVLALVTHSLGIAITGLILCYISYGFAPTGSTAFIGAFFGQKNFSMNLGILNLQLILTSFAATLAGSLKVATGSFVSMYIILAAFSVVGLVLNIFIKKP